MSSGTLLQMCSHVFFLNCFENNVSEITCFSVMISSLKTWTDQRSSKEMRLQFSYNVSVASHQMKKLAEEGPWGSP